MKVHQILGAEFPKKVCKEALGKEFIPQSILYEREKLLQIDYNSGKLNQFYKADFVCFRSIILE